MDIIINVCIFAFIARTYGIIGIHAKFLILLKRYYQYIIVFKFIVIIVVIFNLLALHYHLYDLADILEKDTEHNSACPCKIMLYFLT